LESPAADVGAGPAADAEERDLFNCLHWLRDLFGTLGGGGDEDSAGVPEPGELWNERYQVLEPLGSGAAGHVCLAYDQQMRRQVALKFPRVESGSWRDRREDLLRDAQMAARFDHRGILPVHELVIPVHGSPCLVMPHCRGGSLRTWLRAHPQPLDPRLCVRLLCVLAEAVQYAHDRRVVHRDLKPENILLQFRRGMAAEGTTAAGTTPERLLDEWQPRIADFGLAVVHDTGSSAADTPYPMGGTLRYMAPEQMRGEVTALGPATDVYALGVVLKELLQGQKPTRSARAPARDPDPDCSRTIPRDVSRIIARCTAHDPQHRYATVADLQADLRRWERDEPVHAGQTPGRVEWFRKWSVRRRRPLGLGVLGLIGLWGALLLARMPSSLEREWSRWGQIPTDFPFAGIEQSGNGSVYLDPKSGQLVIVSSRARMAQLGNLPPGGDLDLSLDFELPNEIADCGLFFGFRATEPDQQHPECARLHLISLTRGPHGQRHLNQARRNIGNLRPDDGCIRHDAWGQLEQQPRNSHDPPLRLPPVTRLRLKIVRGIVTLVSIDGQPVPHFQGLEFNRLIDTQRNRHLSSLDLNLAGPFGVYVNDRRSLNVSLPRQEL
jgi:serine/threonine protein kinase